MNIQCDNVIVERRPDVVIINKMEKTAIIIDVAIAGDKRITEKEKEKIEKYRNLKRHVQRLWNLKKMNVIPGLLGALGCVTKNFEKYADKIGIKIDFKYCAKNHIIGDSKNIKC